MVRAKLRRVGLKMGKLRNHWLWIALVLLMQGGWACSQGGVVGNAGPGGEKVRANLAAPMQESGTTTVREDPQGKIKYKILISKEDIVENNDGVLLKGIVQRIYEKAPELDGHILRIEDFRTEHKVGIMSFSQPRRYIDLLLKADPQQANQANFEVELKVFPFTLQDLLEKDVLYFFINLQVASDPFIQNPEMTDCDDQEWCGCKDWNPATVVK